MEWLKRRDRAREVTRRTKDRKEMDECTFTPNMTPQGTVKRPGEATWSRSVTQQGGRPGSAASNRRPGATPQQQQQRPQSAPGVRRPREEEASRSPVAYPDDD